MKMFISLIFLSLMNSGFAQENLNCQAMDLNASGSKLVEFSIKTNVSNEIGEVMLFGRKEYGMTIRIDKSSFMSVVMDKSGEEIIYSSQVWLDATNLDKFEFSFKDGRKNIAVFCRK